MRLLERLSAGRFGYRQQLVFSQQASQAQRSKSASRLTQHGTAGERLGCIPMFEIDQSILQEQAFSDQLVLSPLDKGMEALRELPRASCGRGF